MESILTSIKKLLGITEEYHHFDADLIMHINSVLSILTQLGVGPSEGFMIEDDSATWYEFIPANKKFEIVKTYIHLKVKTIFDPPANSVVMESMNRMANELEWRINILAEEMPYEMYPSNDKPSNDLIPPKDEPSIFTVKNVTVTDHVILLNYDGKLPNDIPEINLSLVDGNMRVVNNGNYDMNFSINNGKLYLSDQQNNTTIEFNISNISVFDNYVVINYEGEIEQTMPALHIDITEGTVCIDNNGNNGLTFSINDTKELEVNY